MSEPDRSAHAAYLAKARFGALDGLRFLCIAAVVYFHMPWAHESGWDGIVLPRGFLGVDFFFVVSGFLITTLLLREADRTGQISLAGFYRRRALRILPLYLLVVTAMVLVYAVLKGDPLSRDIWPYYYLFLANFLPQDIPNLSPMWSLSVEEQYYLLWPLAMILLPRRALLPLLGGLLVLVMLVQLGAIWSPPPEAGPLVFKISPGYMAILLGSALAILLHHRAGFDSLVRLAGHRWAIVAALVLLLVEFALFPVGLNGWQRLALQLTMTAVLLAAVIREDNVLMPALHFAPVARLGQISFGIYLLHLIALYFAIELTALAGQPYGGLMTVLLYLGLTVGLAELSFRTFESYFLSLKSKPTGTVKRLPG